MKCKVLRVLVVTLYSGENEYDDCKQSVTQQVGVDTVHMFIEYLPKKEAHQKLFQIFNESRNSFDYLLKLDADMVFVSPHSLRNILENFSDGVDVVSATVHDGMTNSDMQGVNVFSNRCRFHYASNDPLFTDNLRVDYPGRHYSYVDNSRSVLHAFDPSPFQAFMFGVHRALKVTQPGRKVPSINNSYHQRVILNQTYSFWLESKAPHLEYALWGASLVFQRTINTPELFLKTDYVEIFDKVFSEGGVSIDQRLSEKSFFSLVKILGVRKLLEGTLLHFFKRIRGK